MTSANRWTWRFVIPGILLGCALSAGCQGGTDAERLTAVTVEHPVWSALKPATTAEGDEADWTAWRGGSRQAVAEADPPIEWRASDARWSIEIPGGNSSPIVCGDRVFLTALIDGEASPQLAVICIDRESGELLWTREAGAPQGRTHRKNGHASATPACDGRRVFACFGSLGMFCYGLDGDLLWNAPLGTIDHQWGAASSPVVAGHFVIQLCDSQSGSSLVAVDAATGRRVWTAPRESHGCWSTPVVVPEERRPLVVVSGSSAGGGAAGWVTAYDLATGAELWRARGTSDIPCPTPVIAEDREGEPLLISATGGNGPVFAIRADGRGDVTESHVAWRHSRGGPYVPSGLALDHRLYLINDSGVLTCYDVSDGREIWRKRLPGVFTASLVAAAGRIYAVSEQGDVFVLAAGDDYELLAVNRLKERCLATPALSGRSILLRTEHRLHCFEPTKIIASAEETTPVGLSQTAD